MEFTEDQKRIIDSRNKNVLVSAAAGSGKTTVLVARVLKLIEEGANIDEFLIVTFTRAAAASMKKKLYEELLKRAENGDRHFADQLERLDFSSICTMHSFCMDVLREQYEKADIDPCFRVMDDAELVMLLSETLDEVLEEAYANRDEGMNRLIALRTVKEVRDLTENLYTYLCTRPDSKEWFEHAISLMEGDLKVYADKIAEEISRSISSAIRIFEQAKAVSMEYGGAYTYVTTLDKDINLLNELCDRDYEYYHNSADPVFEKIASKPKDADETKAKAAKDLRDKGKKAVSNALSLAATPLETAREDLRFDVPVFRKLYEMAEQLRSVLREKKKERSVLTFDDMEHYALEVLSDPEAAAAVRRRFKYVFIDEYQDTSDTQNALISAVAGDNNLFMVGDIKQSIYRFRNAVPELFQQRYETYRRGEDPLSECIVLRENFRSRKSILDFVNRVFKRVMVGGSSDIDYDDDARLNPGGTFKGPDAPVELMIVDQKGRSDEADGEAQSDGEAPENDRKEAIAVAQRIRELHEEGIEYKEICVLSRSKTHMASMAEVFASESIPCYAEGVEGYFDTAEVLVLRAALKLLADRGNEIALLAILHSPMFGVTEPELAQMKLGMPKETPLWEAADMESENNPKIARFFAQYEVWRECLHGFGLCELIRKILSDTGFYAFAGALPGGEQRQANLDLFCANALTYEQNFGCSLTGLLEFLEKKQAKDEAGGAGVLGENDNVVRLMTDHKSKGLEFKVVFAVNLGKSFSQKRPDPVALFKDKELGIGMPHLDLTLKSRRDSLIQRAIKQKNDSKELAEELRVLYVTMTRAIDRLILVGSVGNLQTALDKWKLLAEEPLGYSGALDIVASAAMACPGSEIMGYGRTDEALPRVDTVIVPGGDMTEEEAAPTDTRAKVRGMLDSDLMDRDLYDTILWKYPEKEKPYAPVKLAVTGLNREFTGGDRLPEVMTAPDFISGRDRNESTDRGTAIHMALRKLDYAPFETNRDPAFVREEVSRQIDNLARRDILTQEECSYVDPALIADFVLSGIGTRFMKAETKKREMSFSLRMPVRRVIPDYPEEGDIFVQGCIDMCFIENGKWILADYKTNRTHNIDELIDHYKYQLDIYAEALETLTGIPVAESYLCLLTLHKQIRVQNGRWEKQ